VLHPLLQRQLRDPLTGLATHALFRDRVEHALARLASGRNGGGAMAVLLVDLNGFERVNDSLAGGHVERDRLLGTMAERLRACTRGADTVARLGGDEFAVLLEDLDGAATAILAAERAIAALGAPVLLDGARSAITVGASIGVAMRDGPGDGEGAADGVGDAETVLREADAAMCAAKERGGGQWARFEPEMHRHAVERLRVEADLRAALERGELSVHYQPIVELDGGGVIEMEALARWAHPTRGMVSPACFIPIAEETGLIVPLGRFVLREACARAAVWARRCGVGAAGAAPVGVSVNLSARQLDDPHLVADVRDALDAAGLPAPCLTLEITESALTHDAALAQARLEALGALGVRLAVDDFGTGYASLNHLQRFPIDVLKVDRSFVDRVARQEQDAALVRAVIALGQALRLRVVAEGIEQPDQRAALSALGCRYGQGYLYARPLPAAEAAAYVCGRVLASAA
jgi:diguanylate cyclase (GGDEF)-like protein